MVGLAEVLPPEEPGNHVWQHIEQRVFPATPTASRGSGLFWRGWALLASIGLIVMSTLFITQVPPEAQREVAFVNEENAIPLWVISMNFDTGELTTQAVSAQALELDQVYQLWMLPEQGDPQSLGIMPVNGGRSAQTFSPALLDILANTKGLAVSIEPPGGSPIATPSGPVVYQAPLTKL